MSEIHDAVVLGAGPAGSAAAIELARRGHSVAVVEKDRFPRRKVCGEFLSPEAIPLLRSWGLLPMLQEAGAESIRRATLCGDDGRRAEFELPGPALGVSRTLLDDLLARHAERLGATLHLGATAEAVEPAGGETGEQGFEVSVAADGGRFRLRARVAVAAWGRWSPLDRSLGRPCASKTRGRFFGWSRHHAGRSDHLAERVELHFFRGGYAGLSRVEGGAVNFAGVASEEKLRRSGGGWEAFTGLLVRRDRALGEALAGLRPTEPFAGTPTVFFERRSPVIGGMLAVGDAAGIRDPFTGAGQSSALAGGVLAAEAASAFLSGEIDFEGMLRAYASGWRRLLGRRFAWDAAFRALLFHRGLRSLALPRIAGLLPRGFLLTRPGWPAAGAAK